MNKKLTRTENGQLAGVAAGLAKHFDIDVTIIRLLFVLATLAGGHGIFIYIILAIIMPIEGSVSDNHTNTEKGPMVA
jgi:phage shock protein C